MTRDPRLEELLVARALRGLTDAEAEELRALGGADDETFDRAVAALELALPHDDEMPAALFETIVASTEAARRTSGSRTVVPMTPRRAAAWPAWVAAAACLALAVGAWAWAVERPPVIVRDTVPAPTVAPVVPPPPVPLATQREQLLASAPDAKRVAWKPTKDAAGSGSSGDVVWSKSKQAGYMRFVGLQPNDAKQFQYQLWIFDRSRDAKYPVDGGVFDVGSNGEVVVAITARLPVDEPTLFAVTVEKPGGVVVSKRERIVVVASPEG